MKRYFSSASRRRPNTGNELVESDVSWRWNELTPEAAGVIRSWPPVALVSSPALAEKLSVTPACLRSWRHRDQGPEPESRRLYGSNPTATYFAVSRLLSWLNEADPADHWFYSRDWILEKLRGWRFTDTPTGTIVVQQALSQEEVEHIAIRIRQKAHDEFFNRATGIKEWPCPQPRRRPQLLRRRVGQEIVLDADSGL